MFLNYKIRDFFDERNIVKLNINRVNIKNLPLPTRIIRYH